jgi:hypothetical protein
MYRVQFYDKKLLQKKPPALQNPFSTSKHDLHFFVGPFLAGWIRIRIPNLDSLTY